MFYIGNYIGIIIAVIIIVLLFIFIVCGYVKAPPDTAFIISGFKKEPKILIGRAGFRIPFFQRLDKLSLKQVTIDIKTEGYIPTLDFINIQVDAVAKVRVSTEPEMIKLAMTNFLNKRSEEIIMDLQDSLQGNMREIIGTMDLKTICNNRDEFGNQVQGKAMVDMRKLGIEIISCNIQNVEDESGLINDMGMDNTAKIKKDAAIAKAESERDIAMAKADADKMANERQIASQTEIAQRENELAIKKAELKKDADIKQAEADAAYRIQEEQQRKEIEITTANANIARQEREVELKAREVEVKEKALEAEIKKEAEAKKFEQQQRSDAELYRRQKDAEAKQFEMEREAAAKKIEAEADKYTLEQESIAKKAQAEAEKYRMLQEAEGVQAKGEAEAKAIRAKGLAEAESMEKKADAYKKYNKAAMAEMLIKVLPDIASSIAEPLKQIDKITIIGGSGEGSGMDTVAGNVPIIMKKLIESMKETTGIDLGDVIKAETLEAKTDRNVHITGIPEIEFTDGSTETKKESE